MLRSRSLLLLTRHAAAVSGQLRALSSDAAHRLVQQRVQGKVALLEAAEVTSAPATRVVFATSGGDAAGLQSALPFAVSPHALREFRARPRETLLLHPIEDDARLADARVLLVGLGAAEKVDAQLLRGATHGALSVLRAKKTKTAVLQVPTLERSEISPARVVELLSQVCDGRRVLEGMQMTSMCLMLLATTVSCRLRCSQTTNSTST